MTALTMFPISLFLVAAIFVIGYVMWEVCYVYKLRASEAAGVGAATLIVILLCLLLLSKACAHRAGRRGRDFKTSIASCARFREGG
jgi:hypothetical protein